MTKANFISSIISSCGIIAVGICFFIFPIDSVHVIGLVLGVFGIVLGAACLLAYLFGRNGSFEVTVKTLISGIISLVCGLVLLLWPDIIFEVVKVTLAVWFFLIGGSQFIIMYSYIAARQKDWVFSLIESAVNLFFGILIVSLPDAWSWLLSTIIAANFLLYGISELIRVLLYHFKAKKRIRTFSLPVVVETAVAGQMMDTIKSLIQRSSDEFYITSDQLPQADNLDVEVLVHLSEMAGQSWGHVDLVAGGMVLTYGNYDRDKANRHFFGLLWDGVLSVCEREEYVKLSVDTVRKTIVSYRLDLDECDRKKLGENLHGFLQDCEPWEPTKKSSYANALVRRGAKLFKLKSGPFRTYFGLNANCALLVKKLLDGTKAPRPRANGGPVTPGAVLLAYENELKRPGGHVLDRRIYVNKRIVTEEKRKAKKTHRNLAELKNDIDRERKTGEEE